MFFGGTVLQGQGGAEIADTVPPPRCPKGEKAGQGCLAQEPGLQRLASGQTREEGREVFPTTRSSWGWHKHLRLAGSLRGRITYPGTLVDSRSAAVMPHFLYCLGGAASRTTAP